MRFQFRFSLTLRMAGRGGGRCRKMNLRTLGASPDRVHQRQFCGDLNSTSTALVEPSIQNIGSYVLVSISNESEMGFETAERH